MGKNGKLSLKHIMGYSVASVAFNVVMSMTGGYVNVFFTNVMGISLTAVGTIMLIARIWDGINDPIMGVIVDRTRHPKGKYRIYLLWGIVPMAVTSILLFYNPNLSYGLKVAYAAVTYILWGMAYTFVNVPHLSMLSLLTSDTNERTKISTIQNIFMFAGGMIAMILVPALAISDEGTNAEGFLISALIAAVIIVICLIITYKSTAIFKFTESKDAPKITWKDRFKAVFANKPLILVSLALFFGGLIGSFTGVQTYFLMDVLGKGDLVLTFSIIGIPAMLLAMAFMPIAMKFEKRTVMMFGGAVFAIASVLWYFVPNTSINMMIILAAIRTWGMGFVMILIWSMLADCVDYSNLKTGKQQNGIVFSTSTFMIKASGGVGGALMNYTLAAIGFVPGVATQSESVANGVKFLLTIGASVVGVLIIAFMLFYPLSKAKMKEIEGELSERNS